MIHYHHPFYFFSTLSTFHFSTAVTKELNQFNKYKVFESKHKNDLSEEDRKKVLSSLIFLKKRRVEQ